MAKGSFSKSLEQFVKNAESKASQNIRKVTMLCLNATIKGSPVDAGTFRANWNVGVNVIDDSYDDSKSGQPSITIPDSIKVGDSIHITNASPYAIPLESGHSDQAPAGVVAPAVRQVEDYLKSKGAL